MQFAKRARRHVRRCLIYKVNSNSVPTRSFAIRRVALENLIFFHRCRDAGTLESISKLEMAVAKDITGVNRRMKLYDSTNQFSVWHPQAPRICHVCTAHGMYIPTYRTRNRAMKKSFLLNSIMKMRVRLYIRVEYRTRVCICTSLSAVVCVEGSYTHASSSSLHVSVGWYRHPWIPWAARRAPPVRP